MGNYYNNFYNHNSANVKPDSVKLAIQLMYIMLAVTLFHGIAYALLFLKKVEIPFIIILFIFVLISQLIFIYFIGKGSNIARIIFTIFSAIGILFSIPNIIVSQDIINIIFIIGNIGLNIYIIFLLFQGSSSIYFRQRR